MLKMAYGEAKWQQLKQNAKDAVSGMTHLNDAQKQALKVNLINRRHLMTKLNNNSNEPRSCVQWINYHKLLMIKLKH